MKNKKPSLMDIGGHLPEYSDYELDSILNIVNGEISTRNGTNSLFNKDRTPKYPNVKRREKI